MSTNWDVARSFAAVAAYQIDANRNTVETAKKNDAVFKNNGVETTGAVAFDNGCYSSCQNGHFEAAA